MSITLESQVALEVLRDFADQALERQLARSNSGTCGSCKRLSAKHIIDEDLHNIVDHPQTIHWLS